MAASTLTVPTSTDKGVQQHKLQLSDVGIRYRLLSPEHRTLKGRINSLFGGNADSIAFWALRNLTLEVRRGDVLGIVGRNGSGKSTLMRVMSGIIPPTEGSVSVQGTVSPMMELGGALNMDLTGRENAYLQGAIFKQDRKQMDALIPEILSFSELGVFFDAPVKNYSSGMISRLAFSLGTQLSPDILLIDEVLSVGDEQFQRKSFFRIKKLIDQGSIVIIVSHNASILEQICNRAIYLESGKLISDGSPKSVIGEYQRAGNRKQ